MADRQRALQQVMSVWWRQLGHRIDLPTFYLDAAKSHSFVSTRAYCSLSRQRQNEAAGRRSKELKNSRNKCSCQRSSVNLSRRLLEVFYLKATGILVQISTLLKLLLVTSYNLGVLLLQRLCFSLLGELGLSCEPECDSVMCVFEFDL